MKVSELVGEELDYWTDKALGNDPDNKWYRCSGEEIIEVIDIIPTSYEECYLKCEEGQYPYRTINTYSLHWYCCGPLIEKFEIAVNPKWGTKKIIWTASCIEEYNKKGNSLQENLFYGNTPQEAICRAVISLVFGDEIDG